jgi:hypothetical protein
MSDKPPPVKSANDARQGVAPGVVRWMLGISPVAVIVGMLLAFWLS